MVANRRDDWQSLPAGLCPPDDRGGRVYAPPWREPATPRVETMSQYERKLQQFHESTPGGGLWDEAEEMRLGPRRSLKAETPREANERKNEAELRVFLNSGAHIPNREIDVFLLFVDQRLTWEQTAERMSPNREGGPFSIESVRALLRRLRMRAGLVKFVPRKW